MTTYSTLERNKAAIREGSLSNGTGARARKAQDNLRRATNGDWDWLDDPDALPEPEPAAAPSTFEEEVSETGKYDLGDGRVYYSRKIEGTTDIELLRKAREMVGMFVLMYGPPGTGKTLMTRAAFPDILYINGNGNTVADDFVGSYVPRYDESTEQTSYEWVDGPLVTAMKEGRPLLVDEIALIDARVTPVLFSAMDGTNEITVPQNPSLGVIKAKPGFFVIGACNPNAPGARMSEALTSRFTVQFSVSTDYDVAQERLGLPSGVVTASSNLNTSRINKAVTWAPQYRELEAFARTSKEWGEAFAIRNLIAAAPEVDREAVQSAFARALGKGRPGLSVD